MTSAKTLPADALHAKALHSNGALDSIAEVTHKQEAKLKSPEHDVEQNLEHNLEHNSERDLEQNSERSLDRNLAVVFDLDGTLTDSKPGIVSCLQSALQASGIAWEGPLDWFIGPPVEQSIVRLMPIQDEAARSVFIEHYRRCYNQTGWAENAVYPGIPELLVNLSASGARLFVCTSKPEHSALRILQKFELDHHFAAVYGDRGHRPHSKVKLLSTLIEERGLDPAATFMVGDRQFDMEAARANGLRGIAVTYGYGLAEELIATQPLAICATPAAVLTAVLAGMVAGT